MRITYDTLYKERLVAIVVQFLDFYSALPSVREVVDRQLGLYLGVLAVGSGWHQQFDVEVLQHYLGQHQSTTRQMLISQGRHGELLLSVQAWLSSTARMRGDRPELSAALEISRFIVRLTCDDDMQWKLVTRILNSVAFVGGPAYRDRIGVNGEPLVMAGFLAACFHQLADDVAGYRAALDDARDKS